MLDLRWIPRSEFERFNGSNIKDPIKLEIIADMCRANTLTAVKRAGSGHLGSSLSAMDIVVFLYYRHMNTIEIGFNEKDRDVYFSSKGHDVPGLYSVLYSLGVLSRNQLMKLRRIGGLDGHPDVSTNGIEANSGSLGMGISKGKGIAIAKQLDLKKGNVYVLTGDGELQEGQIYESLQTAAHQKINNLIVIVDHNKVQSDKEVSVITDLGGLEKKISSFGWHVERCNGHDFSNITAAMMNFKKVKDRPKVLIADTIKGKGVSFMEHPIALREGNGVYRWHSGAPDDSAYIMGFEELIDRINSTIKKHNLDELRLESIPPVKKAVSSVSKEYVADAFGKALIEIAAKRKDIVVIDSDLAADCRVREFEEIYPERFIENGIAEQDAVSTAGGLALQGYLPVVNSFASFLASRSNEQIYTNACERTRIIYALHYAGLIPAGPGKSHQSVRDISLLSALPNIEIIQPCNATETHMAVNYCIEASDRNCAIRLVIGPSPLAINLPEDYFFESGKGTVLKNGNHSVMFSYGPVMLNEALYAAEILSEKEISLKVVNMPWLNRADPVWLAETVKNLKYIFVLEDHSVRGGLAEYLLPILLENRMIGNADFKIFGIEDFPEFGTPPEVLSYHGLDGPSLADRIVKLV